MELNYSYNNRADYLPNNTINIIEEEPHVKNIDEFLLEPIVFFSLFSVIIYMKNQLKKLCFIMKELNKKNMEKIGKKEMHHQIAIYIIIKNIIS